MHPSPREGNTERDEPREAKATRKISKEARNQEKRMCKNMNRNPIAKNGHPEEEEKGAKSMTRLRC